MDAERRREEAVVGRTGARPEAKGNQRSTGLVVLGVVLLLLGGYGANTQSSAGGFLMALLGIGLIVAGIVVRPRT